MVKHFIQGNNGIKWYFHLLAWDERNKYKNVELEPTTNKSNRKVLGLFDDHPRETIQNKIIVHIITPDDKRLFTLFDNLHDYVEAFLKLETKYRTYFETIIGPQKPHFDIDIDLKAHPHVDDEQIKDLVIDNIIKVMDEHGVKLKIEKDILLFTSHGPEKRSYHIVVNNYSHSNHKQAEKFFYEVVKDIPKEYVDDGIVDKSVYKSIQQFRIQGNQKFGSNRLKIFNETWQYHDQTITYQYMEEFYNEAHKYHMQLEAGLVGYVHGCRLLPFFGPHDDTIHDTGSGTGDGEYQLEDLDPADIKLAIRRLKDYEMQMNGNKTCPFTYRGVSGGLIMLQRNFPSYCNLCHRTHENEHPYMFIIGRCKTLYFHCRRASPDDKLFITQLRDPAELDEVEKEVHHKNIIGLNKMYEELREIEIKTSIKSIDIGSVINDDLKQYQMREEQRQKNKEKYEKMQQHLSEKVAEKIASGQATVNGGTGPNIDIAGNNTPGGFATASTGSSRPQTAGRGRGQVHRKTTHKRLTVQEQRVNYRNQQQQKKSVGKPPKFPTVSLPDTSGINLNHNKDNMEDFIG